ncbi:MAG: hypothetical protein CSA66_06745 [Proteobacteria bacterium]|nr:MAG: hypothetical protein CSA66_06745 [Pseudomonadota bacterium]
MTSVREVLEGHCDSGEAVGVRLAGERFEAVVIQIDDDVVVLEPSGEDHRVIAHPTLVALA